MIVVFNHITPRSWSRSGSIEIITKEEENETPEQHHQKFSELLLRIKEAIREPEVKTPETPPTP